MYTGGGGNLEQQKYWSTVTSFVGFTPRYDDVITSGLWMNEVILVMRSLAGVIMLSSSALLASDLATPDKLATTLLIFNNSLSGVPPATA